MLAFSNVLLLASSDSFTVVIDAGHGGKDTGAIENNVREKDVNLAVALKLAKLLNKKDKDLKVVLTRDKDVFLTLQQRADIANNAKADLFISIHTNSLDLKNPNRATVEGASTYTLGLHKDRNNMEVARRENAVMAYESDYDTKYSGFDPNSDESYIIFEMAQKANLAQSVKFAESVQKQLVNVAGRKDRGVKQAGFWVLWATSMPAVLVELDFVTNPTVAEFISSENGQNKLANAICNATVAYFNALEAERKNGKKLIKENSSEINKTGNSDDGEVTLANADAVSQKRTTSLPKNDNTSTIAGSRRRRNDKSKENSMNQQYETAIIESEREYVIDNEIVTSDEPSSVSKSEKDSSPSNKKNEKEKKKKENKNQKTIRIVNGRSVEVSSSDSKSVAASSKKETKPSASKADEERNLDEVSPSTARSQETTNISGKDNGIRLEKKKVVYRIQILASYDHLKSNNPRFCGLSPIRCTKQGDLYKYTYGETNDSEEINRMLINVRKKIPDAFIVSTQE